MNDKVEQVRSTVREQYEKIVAEQSGDYQQTDESVYLCKNFKDRIAGVGMKLYLDMLDSGGTLPGKTQVSEAAEQFMNGMTQTQKSILVICCYEASCAVAFEYQMKGKMDSALGRAAANPKSVQEDILDNDKVQ